MDIDMMLGLSERAREGGLFLGYSTPPTHFQKKCDITKGGKKRKTSATPVNSGTRTRNRQNPTARAAAANLFGQIKIVPFFRTHEPPPPPCSRADGANHGTSATLAFLFPPDSDLLKSFFPQKCHYF